MRGVADVMGVMVWRVTFVYLVLALDLTLEACEGIPGPCLAVFLAVMY